MKIVINDYRTVKLNDIVTVNLDGSFYTKKSTETLMKQL